MPKGDRTGPMGTGAISGRAAGFCTGFDMPGYTNPTVARRLKMGMGRRGGGWGGPTAGGRGWRSRSFAAGRMGPMYFGGYAFPPQPFNSGLEKESLRSRSQALQSELDAVSKRLVEIESQEKAP